MQFLSNCIKLTRFEFSHWTKQDAEFRLSFSALNLGRTRYYIQTENIIFWKHIKKWCEGWAWGWIDGPAVIFGRVLKMKNITKCVTLINLKHKHLKSPIQLWNPFCWDLKCMTFIVSLVVIRFFALHQQQSLWQSTQKYLVKLYLHGGMFVQDDCPVWLCIDCLQESIENSLFTLTVE